MDSVFFLDEEARDRFLLTLAQALGCTYLCLWSYYPLPANHLSSIYGWFNDIPTKEPSSSSHQGLVRMLFDAYQRTAHNLGNGFVPGLAFKEGVTFLEFKELDLLNRSSTEIQRQFYQEASIKRAIFMGCKSGEIEIGHSNDDQSTNMEMEIMNWFPNDFSHQGTNIRDIPRRIIDQSSWATSSNSPSLLSVGSPEYSSYMLNIPSTSLVQEPSSSFHEQTIRPNSFLVPPNQSNLMQSYIDGIRNIQLPNAESVDAALTKAMLAVMSSPSSSSSSHHPQTQHKITYPYHLNQETSAFKRYTPSTSLFHGKVPIRANLQGQEKLKQAITFYRNMFVRRRMIIEEQDTQVLSRPTSAQLHHKMSERKRREKLNDIFEALRSILPPGSKKDKVSVLSNTRDYVSALKAEVLELKQTNRLLERRHPPIRGSSSDEAATTDISGTSNRMVEIQITQASESTSEERQIDLQINVRRHCDLMDLVSRLLEFLKQVMKDVKLDYMEAGDTQSAPTDSSVFRVIFRLKLKGNQRFDESTFKEAIERILMTWLSDR